MVGLFDDATASYADRVTRQVGAAAVVAPVTVDTIRTNPSARELMSGSDLVLTFFSLQAEVEARNLAALPPVRGDTEETAAVDPMARMAVVSCSCRS